MPRPGFVGWVATPEDWSRLAEIRRGAPATADKILREIAQFETVRLANPNESPADQLGLFASQWQGSGRSAKTFNVILADFHSVRLNPEDLEAAKARVENLRFTGGVKRAADRTACRLVRLEMPCAFPGVPGLEPRDPGERDKLAFWCLVCVTGNRPAHVLGALNVVPHRNSVNVYWGERKVRSDVMGTYLFCWTAVPPVWVRRRWSELRERPWPFPKTKTIASAVDRWLPEWGFTGGISTCARETLDRTLFDLVKLGIIHETEYEILIDHTIQTGLTHYRRMNVAEDNEN